MELNDACLLKTRHFPSTRTSIRNRNNFLIFASMLAGAAILAGCQTSTGRGAAMGAATGGSVVGGAAIGAASGVVTSGPSESAVGGGARGAAMGSATGGNAVTGAIIGGTAGAIRSANANEPAGTCYEVATNKQVQCPR